MEICYHKPPPPSSLIENPTFMNAACRRTYLGIDGGCFSWRYADNALENNAVDRMALKHLDQGFNYSKQLDKIFTFFLLE
jgi:hypothetical protein